MESSKSKGDQLAAVILHYGLADRIYSRQDKIVCPFHPDRNPSMKVDYESGEFYCFGCGARGDAFIFMKKMEGMKRNLNSLEELVLFQKIVNGTAKSELPSYSKQCPEATRSYQRQLYVQAYDLYHGLRKVDWMSPETTEEIRIASYMKDRGFCPETLAEVKAKVTYRDPYQLIFPILDNGKFKGWVSRTDDPETASYRKYLYNKGFRRSNCLVGDYGKFGDERDDYVVVVEGFMDRLKFLQFGVKNVVALFGWKMSENQKQKLFDCGIMNLVSALDNDECGRKGTECLRKDFNVTRMRYLKGIKDPGDMTQETFNRMWKRTMYDYRQSRKVK